MVDLNFPNAVTDPKDFFGRTAELQLIQNLLQSRQKIPVIIFGERRIGKTSLQNVSIRSAEGYTPLLIEPRGIKTFNQLCLSILQSLANTQGKPGSDPELVQSLNRETVVSIDQFEFWFMRLVGEGNAAAYLLCIDEFEEILRSLPEPERQRVLGLIHWLIEKTPLNLRLFFTMTRPDTLQAEIPSPLLSKAQPFELQPLSLDELEKMVVTIFQDQTTADCLTGWIYDLSGGHPYFAKLLMNHCLRWNLAGTQGRERALALAIDDPRADHAVTNLYKTQLDRQEQALMLALVQRDRPIPSFELRSASARWLTVARRLEKRAYLMELDDAYRYRIIFLEHWFRNWIEYDEALDTLKDEIMSIREPAEIEVNPKTGQVMVRGKPVKLSVQEFNLILILAENGDSVVERDHIIDQVWKTHDGVTPQTLDTAVYRLRRKIKDQGEYITTVSGKGFKLSRSLIVKD